MSYPVAGYIRPGTYVQEKNTPNGSNVPALNFIPVWIGTGSRFRRVENEEIVRGTVPREELTFSATPHRATLANRGTRAMDRTRLFRIRANGTEDEVPDQYVSYVAPTVLGTAAGPYDLSASGAFALEMDGQDSITILLQYNAVQSVTISGRLVTVNFPFAGTAGDAATRANVAAAINAGLAAAGALGFGAAYAAVATDATTGVRITSPITTAAADIRIFQAIASNVSATLFGAATLDAATIIEVSDTFWDATATWELDYVDREGDESDAPAETPTTIVRVSGQRDGSPFVVGEDFTFASGEISWAVDTVAELTGSSASTYDLSGAGEDLFTISIDDGTEVQVDLVGAAAFLGYTTPGAPAAVTAAQAVVNINAFMGRAYGPRYNAVASVATIAGSDYVRIRSVREGRAGSVRVRAQNAGEEEAVLELFGLASTVLPYEVNGEGRRPALGSIYYLTYDYARPTADYNRPLLHVDAKRAAAIIGQPSAAVPSYNPLAIATQIGLESGLERFYTVQINDAATPGQPTTAEIQAALDAVFRKQDITEVVVVDEPGHRAQTRTALIDHVERANALEIGRPRRVFLGMPLETEAGDSDTVDTFIYAARNVLLVSPDSPGRGRMFLVAGPALAGTPKDIRLEDSTDVTLTLDSSYHAVQTAAQRCALRNPSQTLMDKIAPGWNTDLIDEPWDDAEVDSMNDSGVLVASLDPRGLVYLDPYSTEKGQAGDIRYAQDSITYQKDTLLHRVKRSVDANHKAVVPLDRVLFMRSLRRTVKRAIEGAIADQVIGPYTTRTNGVELTREIDEENDIQIAAHATNPRAYEIGLWAMGRYPAALFFISYSFDVPFFTSANAQSA